MTLTIDDVKKLIVDFRTERNKLGTQFKKSPDSVNIYDVDRDDSYSLVSVIEGMRLDTMPDEAVAMHSKLVEDLNKFTNIVNNSIGIIEAHNQKVSDSIDALTRSFKASIVVPELELSAALRIGKKVLAESDHAALVDVYKEMGFTHFSSNSKMDVLYYNPDKWYYQTLRDQLFGRMPYSFRSKYPNFVNYMQNSHVPTQPDQGDGLLQVMAARQA